MPDEWGYLKSNGPPTWVKLAPAAAGKHQSPIDIVPSTAKFEKKLTERPLHFKYDGNKAKELINNGTSVQLIYDSAGSSLEGGPLSNKYKLVQFHFHWGQSSATGSEHRINGEMYAGETHLVHYNAEKYDSFADAAQAPDGLCVLGIFLQPGEFHCGLEEFTKKLKYVKFKGDKVPMNCFDPASLLPDDTERYWTYPGSLTTPPCYESVRWIVFKQPIEVSEDQLDKLRNLRRYTSSTKQVDCCDEYDGHIVENYRPPLPVTDRTVISTFRKFFT